MDIAEIDKSFALEKIINKDGLDFYNVLQAPLKLYGVFMEDGEFVRMPRAVAKTVSEKVYKLNPRTAGGRVKFKTDSKKVAIIAKMAHCGKMPHFAFSGSTGFDMYVKRNGEERFAGSFIPSVELPDVFEGTVTFENDGVSEITVNFPTYSSESEVLVGIEEGAVLSEADNYKIQKPVVFYGSSITQGGCSSRPGNTYEAILSRKFDFDYINLGFSGNARGEKEMFDYIKQLDMSVFVYDYDHNAPTPEHLAATHEAGFLAVREQNPDLPIIIMSRPKYYLKAVEEERLEIIRTTYRHAVEKGDKNVYLIDGKQLMRIAKDNGTVDGTHPNDLGFFSMADAVSETLEMIWKK